MRVNWHQKLHIEPPEGWLNDPNGLSYFNGKYHVYFQYSPGSAEGKTPRCWGHYSGKSLLDLTYEGIVLQPTIHEDKDGVYSGSAVVWNSLLHIFYTGNVKEEGDYDYIYHGRGANVIHVTSKDGQAMSEKQVVLRNSDYPDFCSCHVRDPKVWRQNDTWYMVLGARTRDDKGCVLFYRSNDLKTWDYFCCTSAEGYGYMWECPDYFKINGHAFLSVSPQGMASETDRYQNLYQSGYFRADDGLTDFTELDMGFDFYAPQTFEAPDGRRILLGWMGMDCKDYQNATVPLGWQHCMTLPRVLTVSGDGHLLQNPIRELDALRHDGQQLQAGTRATFSPAFELNGKPEGDFKVSLAGGLAFGYDGNYMYLKFSNDRLGCGRTVRRARVDECRDFRMIVDCSSVEVYINGGRTVMSTRFYPQSEKVSVLAEGTTLEVWQLTSA